MTKDMLLKKKHDSFSINLIFQGYQGVNTQFHKILN